VSVSDSLNSLSDFAERLYWRLLAQTDPCGRLPGSATKLRLMSIPRLSVTDEQMISALEELVAAARITLYCEKGVWACQILGFDESQPLALMGEVRHSRFPAPATREYPQQKSVGNPPLQQQLKGVSDLTTEANYEEPLPISQNEGEAEAAIALLFSEIRDASESTLRFLRAKQREGLPASEFYDARQALRLRRESGRRALVSEARFVNAVLSERAKALTAA
jgi:hypothetical protein